MIFAGCFEWFWCHNRNAITGNHRYVVTRLEEKGDEVRGRQRDGDVARWPVIGQISSVSIINHEDHFLQEIQGFNGNEEHGEQHTVTRSFFDILIRGIGVLLGRLRDSARATPSRGHGPSIVSHDGSPLVSLRPYHYPHVQKGEIEKLITIMLRAGIIRGSHIPFSSPVLLYKKKDGSWCFCIDY